MVKAGDPVKGRFYNHIGGTMKIPSFFRKKIRVVFHLKSGATLRFKCDSISAKRDANMDISAYTLSNADNAPFYVRLDDISAIETHR